ncbi:hypothetical protein SLS56_010443 [Neofusicoccum ribis]|uniref:Peptidase A1 domain-containing protein n=1 Tax=Neofusicoccum ribis TaxID=45134 RepID=A0ABR3SEF8_9PEZI
MDPDCSGDVHGSLILGGYDPFRFNNDSSLNISFSNSDDQFLKVQVKTITSSAGQTDISLSGFIANVEFAFSFMWLPRQVCDVFASTFGLEWNATLQLYFVNDIAHKKNSAEKSSIIFDVCNPHDQQFCSKFSFPYAAFALNATYPLVPDSEWQRYFPIKRAANSSQCTLGRVFLQETHLFADFDNGWFNISQARFDNSGAHQIVTVFDAESTTTNGTQSGNQGLSGGKMAAIIAGSIGALLLALASWILLARRKNRWPFRPPAPPPPPPETFAKAELEGTGRPWIELSEAERLEMHAQEPPKELPDANATLSAELPGTTPLYELDADEQPRP